MSARLHVGNPVRDWLVWQALPLWADAGWDSRAAMFVERLDLAGRPLLDLPRRVMVQARQIFVYCVAAEHDWFEGAAERAVAAAETLVRHFQADGHPGWAFACDRKGAIVDGRRDLYAQAFVLLAFAELRRLTGEGRWIERADETLEFLDTAMATPETGGYVECIPPMDTPRRQNPHMHLLEAFLALHEMAPEREYLRRAGTIVELMERRFLHGTMPVLVEYFDASWRPRGASPFSFEPGHHFEWAWLLRRFALLGGAERTPIARALYRSGFGVGSGPTNLIVDEVRDDGAIVDGSLRLWPHTEAAKAATLEFAPAQGLETADAFLSAMYRQFLSPAIAGSWIDRFDPDGRAASPDAPASSLYHITSAVREVERMRAGLRIEAGL